MKTGFTVMCIIGLVFISSFATFNICITHTENAIKTVNNRIALVEAKNAELEQKLIDHQINHNTTDTLVLSVMPQHVNVKFNSKK